MMMSSPLLSGSHKTQLYLELVHAGVVIVVVLCTTILAFISTKAIPQDVVGTVFGGAIGYAAGRSGGLIAREAGTRSTDPPQSSAGVGVVP